MALGDPHHIHLVELVARRREPVGTHADRLPGPAAAAYMTSSVSQTSIDAPPASTGQPFESVTAASRLSAVRTE